MDPVVCTFHKSLSLLSYLWACEFQFSPLHKHLGQSACQLCSLLDLSAGSDLLLLRSCFRPSAVLILPESMAYRSSVLRAQYLRAGGGMLLLVSESL